jgi:hypothetical protein
MYFKMSIKKTVWCVRLLFSGIHISGETLQNVLVFAVHFVDLSNSFPTFNVEKKKSIFENQTELELKVKKKIILRIEKSPFWFWNKLLCRLAPSCNLEISSLATIEIWNLLSIFFQTIVEAIQKKRATILFWFLRHFEFLEKQKLFHKSYIFWRHLSILFQLCNICKLFFHFKVS